MNKLVKVLVASVASCFTALALAACAAPVEPIDGANDDDAVASVAQPVAASCCSGFLTCPDSPPSEPFEYAPPGCGGFTRLQATSACNSFCTATCIDSGWICP